MSSKKNSSRKPQDDTADMLRAQLDEMTLEQLLEALNYLYSLIMYGHSLVNKLQP